MPNVSHLNVLLIPCRFRASEITATDVQFLQYVLLADDYDYASYDTSESEFSWYGTSFDYYTAFANASASFNYTEFTRRAGFVLDEATLIECTWRGRKCSAQVSECRLFFRTTNSNRILILFCLSTTCTFTFTFYFYITRRESK